MSFSQTLNIRGRSVDAVEEILQDDFPDIVQARSQSEWLLSHQRKQRFSNSISAMAQRMFSQPKSLDIPVAVGLAIHFYDIAHVGHNFKMDAKTFFEDSCKYDACIFLELERRQGILETEPLQDKLDRMRQFRPAFDFKLGRNDSFWSDLARYRKNLVAVHSQSFNMLVPFMKTRRFFANRLGYIGWVPRDTQEGDLICALYGNQIPFIIRPVGENYKIIGAAYIQGLMYGEGHRMPNIHGGGEDMMITFV